MKEALFMPIFRGDILIKELRKNKGLTQEKLCNGICTKDALSRIERGLCRPDWYTFERLMQRLGENPQIYFTDIATIQDKYIMDLKNKLNNLLREKDDKSKIEVETLINELESNKDFKKGINLQFLLLSKATHAFNCKDYNSMYYHAVEALKITKPDFDEEKINTYILFFDEIKLINQIAVSYSFLTSVEKSTEILLKLKTSIDKGYVDGDEKIKTYIPLLYNITKNLGLLKRFGESIPICDTGIELCLTHRNSFYYPMFLFNKAYCLLHLDKKQEGIDFLEKIYALLTGYERFAELSKIESYVEKEFGISIRDLKTQHHNQEYKQPQPPANPD